MQKINIRYALCKQNAKFRFESMIVYNKSVMSSCKETPKKIYNQKTLKNVNEFCRCCNASLKIKYGDTWKSVSTVNLFKPAVGQGSFAVLLQNIGIVCERGPEWSERLCRTCAGKIKRTCDGFTFISNNLNALNPECFKNDEDDENLQTERRVKRGLPITLFTPERSPRIYKAPRDKKSKFVPYSTKSTRKSLVIEGRHNESQQDSDEKKNEKDGPNINIHELPIEIGDILGGQQTRIKVLIQ